MYDSLSLPGPLGPLGVWKPDGIKVSENQTRPDFSHSMYTLDILCPYNYLKRDGTVVGVFNLDGVLDPSNWCTDVCNDRNF